MNPIADRNEASIEEIRRWYKELKRGNNVDPYLVKKEITSFIDSLKAQDESCSDLKEEVEDMLIDVTFIIKESSCSPMKAKSIK